LEIYSVLKTLLDRNVEPTEEFKRVKVVDYGQCIKFMQAWHNVPVFDVSQTADMQNKVGTPTSGRKFIAG